MTMLQDDQEWLDGPSDTLSAQQSSNAARPSSSTDHKLLECKVGSPVKEQDGTKDAFISYLVSTRTDFPSFQKHECSVRRRFSDFAFLAKALAREYPACAVPPIPDKQRMEYVRGDRFGSEFTRRRGKSLERFLVRLSMHPILRRAEMLHEFLESGEWNATMRTRTQRASSHSEPSTGVFDVFADTLINAFTKVNKADPRFVDVRERSDKLDEDLAAVEKVVARVARRESELETDTAELAEQFRRLQALEPGVEKPVAAFSTALDDASRRLHMLRDVTDTDYLGSLRDMQAYSQAVKLLLKAREQKQLDYEQLTEYLQKTTHERESLQGSAPPPSLAQNATGFLRSKFEDARGVDHETARRERLRKAEMRIEVLSQEAEEAKHTSSRFDDEVVREATDFDRIRRAEFKTQFAQLADAHTEYYDGVLDVWTKFLADVDAA